LLITDRQTQSDGNRSDRFWTIKLKRGKSFF